METNNFTYPHVCMDCENRRNGKKKCFWGNKCIERAAAWGGDGICLNKAMNEAGFNAACDILAKAGL